MAPAGGDIKGRRLLPPESTESLGEGEWKEG